jgi:hypothetical protein
MERIGGTYLSPRWLVMAILVHLSHTRYDDVMLKGHALFDRHLFQQDIFDEWPKVEHQLSRYVRERIRRSLQTCYRERILRGMGVPDCQN